MSETNTRGLPDIPFELITEAQKTYPQVCVRIMRKANDGRLSLVSGCSSLIRETVDLHNIQALCEEMGGGGQYFIRATNPMDIGQLVVPGFYVRVEGVPKARPGAAPLMTQQGNGQPQVPYVLQPMMATSNQHYNDGSAPVASMASDEVAMGQLQVVRNELQQERALREKERADTDARQKKLDEQLIEMNRRNEETKREAERQVHQTQLKALEDRLEALSKMPAPVPQAPKIDLVAMTVALVPLGVALLEANKSSANAAVAAQQKSLDTMLAVATKKDTNPGSNFADILKGVAPLIPALVPVLKQMMDERSPTKTAALVNAMGEANMTQLSLVMQLIQSMTAGQQEPPVWLPVVQGALGSLIDITRHVVTTKQAPAAAPQAPATQQMAPGADQMAALRALSPEQVAQALLAEPRLDADLKSPEWAQLYIMLHAQKPAKVVGDAFANHLQALDNAGKLPKFFETVFDEDSKPGELLAKLLLQLPVNQLNPQYVQEVLHSFDGVFVIPEEDIVGGSGESVEDESEEEEPEDQVTPVQASNGVDKNHGTSNVFVMRTPGSPVHA